MIVFVQPSTPVTTWRSLWPGQELRRRGHEVEIHTMDAGYVPDAVAPGALTIVHVTPSLWAHEPWHATFEEARRNAGELVVSFDDDWSRLLDLPTEGAAGW